LLAAVRIEKQIFGLLKTRTLLQTIEITENQYWHPNSFIFATQKLAHR